MSADPRSPKPVRRRAARGFTLIEIMLVVVIIGILSSFAIPYFQRVTARARRAEANIVLDKLHVYFVNQYENSGTFYTSEICAMNGLASGCSGTVTSAWNPDPAVTTGQPAAWDQTRTGFTQIPFAFEGGLKLRYQYSITAAGTMTFTVVGNMPGLGPVTGSPASNYTLTELVQGPTINAPVEIPTM